MTQDELKRDYVSIMIISADIEKMVMLIFKL